MKYADAIELGTEEEVFRKGDNELLYVKKTYDDVIHKKVYILCDDGNWYRNSEIYIS